MGRVGVAIRGADPRHTLMLIDGQPVMGSESKYMGGSDEAMRIGAENIERIEIIRGAATAKYGPDAIGGVINIITKAPSDHPTFQLNAEARYHNHEGTDENKNTWPTNFYMRADTGKVGNAKFSIFGSKREIMPVYSKDVEFNANNSVLFQNFRPSLRYYGDTKTIGATGEVELNENNKLSFRVMNEKEDMQRRNHSADGGDFEPMQIFKRNMTRDTYALSYTGKNDKHDWKVDVNYGNMREDDSTLLTYYGSGHDQYSGKNILATVDWLEHKQLDVNATMNTQVNDKHLLTYGIGYTDERADGTRLKNAPKRWTKSIDPWKYDKSLYVPYGSTEPDSYIHDYVFKQDKNGLIWDKASEYYGGTTPAFTEEDAQILSKHPEVIAAMVQYGLGSSAIGADLTSLGIDWKGDSALQKRFEDFNTALKEQNKEYLDKGSSVTSIYNVLPVLGYYELLKSVMGDAYTRDENILFNGKYYGQEFLERENQVSGGEARIQRRHAFIQDTWQVNDDTIITPILRVDHSDLFGTHATANLGMTHNLNGNAHRRLKINAGTGYAEPGMGELYYNWEMYGSSGGNRYGWYWIGNPNLKPEKSVNFDISLEGENNKTYAKASVFHNVINDYMTSYFMGQLIDFNQLGANTVFNADRIYSFKNIGKAEITGFEAEVQQRFNDKWSAKLGYAWLHAINKSDPDMPRTLLDRPQHKIDISFNYEDKKHGWKAALWGDYYIHMLDSNSVTTAFTSADVDANGNWKKKQADYQKKTFGIWNFMVEKQVNPDATIYVGIDNLFNHRDDDRAYADRTYRIGANIKFGYDAKAAAEKAAKKAAANAQGTAEPSAVDTTADNGTVIMNQGDWFLTRPSDKDAARKQGDVKLIGDYRVRSNMYGGQDNVAMTLNKNGNADNGAVTNMKNAPGHGLEQRLRLGVDAQLGDNTNLLVEGSSGNTVDTKYSKADKRGLHDTRLERAELNQKANKWDFTIGRLTEKMGVTGYWFGKEYDGVRATWTGDKTQVRIGYGDFSKSTGITDSAYVHAESAMITRPVTLAELLGMYPGWTDNPDGGHSSGEVVQYQKGLDGTQWQNSSYNYLLKYVHAGETLQADGTWQRNTGLTDLDVANLRMQALQELNTQLLTVANAYPNDASALTYGGNWYKNTFLASHDDPASSSSWSAGTKSNTAIYFHTINTDGTINTDSISTKMLNVRAKSYKYEKLKDKSWGELLDATPDAEYGTVGKRNIYEYLDSVYNAVTIYCTKNSSYKGKTPFVDTEGKALSKSEALDQMYIQFVGGDPRRTQPSGAVKVMPSGAKNPAYNNQPTGIMDKLFYQLRSFDPFGQVEVPISALGALVQVPGVELKQDIIPAIDRATFIQVRQKLNDNLGLTAWYLRSSGEEHHKTGYNEDMSIYQQDMNVANVFGLGAQWKLGASRLSFDWGVNRSETGRYFNGGRDAYGRYTGGGSNPTFWVLRADIGHADTDRPGSWNAFADYKYFQHGAFFGGNGTEALPDRYLDGIRSFTLGAGYVPAKNFLVEAFYTFGAKSTGQRDTLYGPESFTLGDYTRVQVSYKF